MKIPTTVSGRNPAAMGADRRTVAPIRPGELIDFIHALADEARRVSLAYFRRPLRVELKPDASPVTEADRAVEALLRARIAARFPTHGVCGEEQGTTGRDAEYLWVIDPLDGTRSFVSGWPLWGTLLALLWRGEPVLGLIDMPTLGERWLGVAGAGTALHDAHGSSRCRSSQRRVLADATVYTTSPDAFDASAWRAFERVCAAARTRRFGGDCYSYGMLASGYLDVVIEAGLQPYDYLALVPVVEAAGGVISDWRGRRLGMAGDGRVLASASPGLHAEVLRLLGSAD